MKPRSLLLLFLFVAGLGAFVWFFERDLPSTDERAERAKKILPIDAGAVTALSIERDGVVVRLERASRSTADESADAAELSSNAAGWRLVEPIAARADGHEINSVLGSLTRLTKERTLEDFEPQELGLSAPRLTVRLTTAETEWVLAVGEEIPATSNVIAALEGRDEAYVVAGDFRDDLERDPGEWRSRDVFPFDREAVTKVAFGGGEGVATVLRRDPDGFRLEAPLADEADGDTVSKFLDVLTGLEIETFVDNAPPLTDLGLEPPVSTLVLEVEGEGDFEIRLGDVAPDDEDVRYALAEDRVIELEAESADELLGFGARSADGWRSRAWATLETFEVDRLLVREKEDELLLERSSGDWLRNGEKIAYTTASDVLYALGDIEARGIGGDDTSRLQTPLLEILLSSKDQDETLELYPEAGGVYPAVREGRETILELTRETVDELRAKIEAARDAEPLSEPSGEEGAGGE